MSDDILKENREAIKNPSDDIEFFKAPQLAKILGISNKMPIN